MPESHHGATVPHVMATYGGQSHQVASGAVGHSIRAKSFASTMSGSPGSFVNGYRSSVFNPYRLNTSANSSTLGYQPVFFGHGSTNGGYSTGGYSYGGRGYRYLGWGNRNATAGYIWVFFPSLGWVMVPIRMLLLTGL